MKDVLVLAVMLALKCQLQAVHALHTGEQQTHSGALDILMFTAHRGLPIQKRINGIAYGNGHLDDIADALGRIIEQEKVGFENVTVKIGEFWQFCCAKSRLWGVFFLI